MDLNQASKNNKQIQPLLDFMNVSPCNFLAINHIKQLLNEAGFQEKKLDEPLKVKNGDKTTLPFLP